MKEAIIYLGCSYPQLPNIKALRDFGIEVIGTDRENINSKTKFLLTEFHKISATDINSLVKLTNELKKKYNLLFAYGIADFCYKSIGKIHKTIGDPKLPIDYSNFFSKIKTSKILKSCKIPHAKLICYGQNIEDFVINYEKVKYTGSSVLKIDSRNNSSGIHLFEETKINNLLKSIKNSEYNGENILLEEQIINYSRLLNLDGIVKNGKFFPIIFTSRLLDKNDKRRTLVMIQPAIDLEQKSKEVLIKYANDLVKKMNYRFGAITIDFAELDTGNFKVLEISPHFHIVSSTIWLKKKSPLVDLIDTSASIKNKYKCKSEKKVSSHIICYQVFSKNRINYKAWKKQISNLLIKGDIIYGYAITSSQIMGDKFCIGLLWKHVSKREQIYSFMKEIDKKVIKLQY